MDTIILCGITRRTVDFNWNIHYTNDKGQEVFVPVYANHLNLCSEGSSFKFTLHDNAAGSKLAKLIVFKELTGDLLTTPDNKWCVEYIDGDNLIVDYPSEYSNAKTLEEFPTNIKRLLIHPDQQHLCKIHGQRIEFRITKYYYSSSSIQGGETESMTVARIISSIGSKDSHNTEPKTEKDTELRVHSVAFSMWLSKYSYIRGPQGQWLNFWEHYDVFMKHETRDSYIQHARNMQPGKNFNK